MADLIDRNATLRQLLECYEYEYPTASGAFDEFATRIVPNIIKNATTVNAVEVVRCKDCTHYIEYEDWDRYRSESFKCHECDILHKDFGECGFCSNGERKD